MDLENIKTVLDVARLKSFSAAAFSVPCSQSSVSRRVDAVESELGMRIFIRPSVCGSRTVELTPGGEDVVKAMVRVVDAYADLFRVADVAEKTTLNLGIRSNLLPPMGLSLMKADYFEDYGGRSISVRTDDFSTLLSEFRFGRLDAVLFSCAEVDADKLLADKNERLRYLGKAGFSVGLSINDPLSNQNEVSLSDLRGEVFLLSSEPGVPISGVTFSNSGRFQSVCREAGFEPIIKTIPNNMLEIRYKLAQEAKGVCPSHSPKVWRKLEGLRYVPVAGDTITVDYFLLHSEGRKDKEIEAFSTFFSRRLEM